MEFDGVSDLSLFIYRVLSNRMRFSKRGKIQIYCGFRTDFCASSSCLGLFSHIQSKNQYNLLKVTIGDAVKNGAFLGTLFIMLYP